jgi:hypothetical protein
MANPQGCPKGGAKPRQLNNSQHSAWENALEVFDEDSGESRQMALYPTGRAPLRGASGMEDAVHVKLSQMRLERPRQWGACWLADPLWQ